MSVSRFGVSLEEELLEALDNYVAVNHFPNRSQAIRHIIQKNIVEHKWQCNHHVVGTVVLVYPMSNSLVSQLTMQLHIEYQDVILSVQRHFVDKHCLELVSVNGTASRLTELSDRLIAVKGVEHGKLVMSKA